MVQQPSTSPTSRKLREELLLWLRSQKVKKRWPWLDRPIVVTFVGGLILAGVAHLWDSIEKARQSDLDYQRAIAQQQWGFLKEVGDTVARTGQVLNAWFTYVIWIAEERTKGSSPAVQKNIEKWEQQILKLQDQYENTPRLDLTLGRVGAIYRCKSVKDAASDMTGAVNAFIDTFQTFNRRFGEDQIPKPEAIAEADQSRRLAVDKLEDLTSRLTGKMAAEIAASASAHFECPP